MRLTASRTANRRIPLKRLLNRIEGTVVLDALIGKDGVIQTLSANSGPPLLTESALQAVKHWAYRLLRVNGIAVEVQTQIEVTYDSS